MSCLRNFVSFVVFTLIIFCIPQLVLADESGTYESVSSFVHDYTKFDFADKKISQVHCMERTRLRKARAVRLSLEKAVFLYVRCT